MASLQSLPPKLLAHVVYWSRLPLAADRSRGEKMTGVKAFSRLSKPMRQIAARQLFETVDLGRIPADVSVACLSPLILDNVRTLVISDFSDVSLHRQLSTLSSFPRLRRIVFDVPKDKSADGSPLLKLLHVQSRFHVERWTAALRGGLGWSRTRPPVLFASIDALDLGPHNSMLSHALTCSDLARIKHLSYNVSRDDPSATKTNELLQTEVRKDPDCPLFRILPNLEQLRHLELGVSATVGGGDSTTTGQPVIHPSWTSEDLFPFRDSLSSLTLHVPAVDHSVLLFASIFAHDLDVLSLVLSDRDVVSLDRAACARLAFPSLRHLSLRSESPTANVDVVRNLAPTTFPRLELLSIEVAPSNADSARGPGEAADDLLAALPNMLKVWTSREAGRLAHVSLRLSPADRPVVERLRLAFEGVAIDLIE